jgi:hypothetical protein
VVRLEDSDACDVHSRPATDTNSEHAQDPSAYHVPSATGSELRPSGEFWGAIISFDVTNHYNASY